MPVQEHPWCVLRNDPERDSTDEGDDQGFRLLSSISFGVLAHVQRANRVFRRDGAGEDQLLLEDIEFAKGNGKEHAIVGTTCREGDEFAHISFGGGTQKTKLVGCWETRSEEQAQGSSRTRSGLAADVFLGSEIASSKMLGQGFEEWLQDVAAKDRAEQRSTEGPASLQSEVDTG